MVVLESDYEYASFKDLNKEERTSKTVIIGTKYKQVSANFLI